MRYMVDEMGFKQTLIMRVQKNINFNLNICYNIKMLEIFYPVWWTCFQQTVGIQWEQTVLRYSMIYYFTHTRLTFIADLIKKEGTYRLAWSFDLRFRYTDDMLCINDHIFTPEELGIKIPDIMKSTSYLDLLSEVGGKGKLVTNLYNKRIDFSFPFHLWHLRMEFSYHKSHYARVLFS